jgi:N utilization substance protein A
MSGEFLEVVQQIARDNDMSPEALLEILESALVTAYRKNYPAQNGEIRVSIDRSHPNIQVFCQKVVVEDEVLEGNEILLEEAKELDPNAELGSIVEIDVTPTTFGRIAAQTAKQVMVQRLREADRERVYEEYSERLGEVVTGVVLRREFKNILIGLGKIEAVLPPQEQVPTEPYRYNDRIKVYMLEVRRSPKGPQVIVSRTHPSLIRRLFELEVPEIADGIVTIKSVAREPGARSKIAVHSRDEKIDPVGSCVGHRGSRVQQVVNELYDEKIDIVRWSPDLGSFIGEALSPAKVVSVTLNEEAKSAFVIVPDNQLSLAIGKSGQNVRLAARLTAWRIDIRSESQVARETLMAATSGGLEDDEEIADDHDASSTNGFAPSAEAEVSASEFTPEVIEDEVEFEAARD